MQPAFTFLMKWGRLGLVFLWMITLIVASAPPAASAAPAGQAPSAPPLPVYVPLLMQNYEPPPPPTSFDLIDLALKAGQIVTDTALEYKTFAEFDDARLPTAYQANDAGGEAGLFMNEVVGAYPSLSADAKAVLAPFFIPPFQAGSWMAQSSRSLAPSAPADWAFISAAGGKARVWYKKADPEMQRKAGVIAAALTSDIWPNETALMGREPKLDGAGVQNIVVYDHYRKSWNGTFVPFGIYAGMAVPQTCSKTASILYINSNLPDSSGVRSSGKVGLIEATAHEFMHALQFSFPLAVNPCTEYRWLGEATATWAEDFIYPDHDSEWRVAQKYLENTQAEINDRTDYRDYGEYLLVYFYTHKYNNPQAVRSAWLAAGHSDSLMSFLNLGDMSADQVVSLWNKKPFGTFFKDNDTLDYHVIPTIEGYLTTTGFKEYELQGNILPGELYIYHYMVDPSVRTISILDGLTTKITAGPYSGSTEDTVYNQTGVSIDDLRGAEVVTLVKFDGPDPWRLINPGRQDFCQDWLKQRVSEILVFMTNQDMTNRKRMVKATGQESKILVSTVPCVKVVGTATRTHSDDGVTETESANGLEYVSETYFPSSSPGADIIAPEIVMRLTGGSVSWNIGGMDSGGCTWSGSGAFTLTEANNSSRLVLKADLLPGSRHFLGYQGTGSTDNPAPEVPYTISCPGHPVIHLTATPGYFFMPDGTIPVKPDGSLKGDVTIDEVGGISTNWVWNFTPATLP